MNMIEKKAIMLPRRRWFRSLFGAATPVLMVGFFILLAIGDSAGLSKIEKRKRFEVNSALAIGANAGITGGCVLRPIYVANILQYYEVMFGWGEGCIDDGTRYSNFDLLDRDGVLDGYSCSSWEVKNNLFDGGGGAFIPSGVGYNNEYTYVCKKS